MAILAPWEAITEQVEKLHLPLQKLEHACWCSSNGRCICEGQSAVRMLVLQSRESIILRARQPKLGQLVSFHAQGIV